MSSSTRRSAKSAALAVGLALVAGACGSDAEPAGGGTSAPATTTAPGTPQMRVTLQLDPKAVWDDGSAIGVQDFQCALDAYMNTPGSITVDGWDQILSIEQGASAQEIVVEFASVYAPYKSILQPLKASAIKDCKDVTDEMQSAVPSAREWKLDSFSTDQIVLVPNDKYWGPEKPSAKKIVIVPKDVTALVAGEVDFVYPKADDSLAAQLSKPNIDSSPGYGTQYEGLFFQQKEGPFADDAFRKGFAHLVDRELVLKTIYQPIFSEAELLDCGPWVPTVGNWCDSSLFDGYYDVKLGEKFLTDGGYKKNSQGLWEKDGKVPEIRFVVDAGNKRREAAVALLIPEMRKAGFNVKNDACDMECFFYERLPALDYDLAMYINAVTADPTVTGIMSCDAIPTPANENVGQNTLGWCNEEASKLMEESDVVIDTAKREKMIHEIGEYIADDAVMLPLFHFPFIAAWRTDKLSGPIDKDASNYQAFQNLWEWKTNRADGSIILGSDDYPECLNPVTECAFSTWGFWGVTSKVLPNVWDAQADGTYKPTALVTGEPKVELL